MAVCMGMCMSEKDTVFPVDGELMMILPRAAASFRNPDVQLPIFQMDAEGYFLEVRVNGDPLEESEMPFTRRVRLNELSHEEWKDIKAQYDNFDLKACTDEGISKGLEKIQDRRIQRLFVALFTFLNSRQVSIVLFLYKKARDQGNSRVVSFKSNELLESLGYTPNKQGIFTARSRSQLNQDLVTLHRTELVFAQSLIKGNKRGAKVIVKSILRIQHYEIDNLPRDFDLVKAADYTYELADTYTVALEFFDGLERTKDYVLFDNNIDIKQKQGSNAKYDYKMKLLIYLANRMKWDKLNNGEYLTISKQYLLKNLDLFGSNPSRNNQILWRTIEELQAESYILDAREVPGKRNTSSIQLQINPEKLRCNKDYLTDTKK